MHVEHEGQKKNRSISYEVPEELNVGVNVIDRIRSTDLSMDMGEVC